MLQLFQFRFYDNADSPQISEHWDVEVVAFIIAVLVKLLRNSAASSRVTLDYDGLEKATMRAKSKWLLGHAGTKPAENRNQKRKHNKHNNENIRCICYDVLAYWYGNVRYGLVHWDFLVTSVLVFAVSFNLPRHRDDKGCTHKSPQPLLAAQVIPTQNLSRISKAREVDL